VNFEIFLVSGGFVPQTTHWGSTPGPRWRTLSPRPPALPPRFSHPGYGPEAVGFSLVMMLLVSSMKLLDVEPG